MKRLTTRQQLEREIKRLIALEPRFGAVHQKHGTPSLRRAEPNLETLLLIVTEQFLSRQAAAAIWQRLAEAMGPISAEAVLASTPERLMQLGLSSSKAKCFHACAAAPLDFAAAPEDLRKTLLAIWGIGPWTADIFILTAIGHADAWPAGDLALQSATQNLLNLKARPSARKLEEIARAWQPHRATAARLLWAHYRGLNGLPQAPSQN
jgi:DNA-3-methyladenine glycosylase II